MLLMVECGKRALGCSLHFLQHTHLGKKQNRWGQAPEYKINDEMIVKNDEVKDGTFFLWQWLTFLNIEILLRQAKKKWKNMLIMFIQLFLKSWNKFSVLFLLIHLLPYFKIFQICHSFFFNLIMSKLLDKRLEIKVNK